MPSLVFDCSSVLSTLVFSGTWKWWQNVASFLCDGILCISYSFHMFDRELLSKEWKGLYWDFIDMWLHSADGDSDCKSAQDCVKKIGKYGKSFLSESLASVFELSLTLRSASPTIVLYRQLAEESLSSFPLVDDISSDSTSEELSEPSEITETKKAEPFLSGVDQQSRKEKCCWVDTGGSLFFDVPELLLWLKSPKAVYVKLSLLLYIMLHMDTYICVCVSV